MIQRLANNQILVVYIFIHQNKQKQKRKKKRKKKEAIRQLLQPINKAKINAIQTLSNLTTEMSFRTINKLLREEQLS